ITTAEPVTIRQGAGIEYQIRWLGLPISWKTLITAYQPPDFFEDEQVRGPYAFWKHRHSFERIEGGTRISDRVEYDLPLGPLGAIAQELAVKRQLRGIFEYRQRKLKDLLGGDPAVYEYSPVEIRAR